MIKPSIGMYEWIMEQRRLTSCWVTILRCHNPTSIRTTTCIAGPRTPFHVSFHQRPVLLQQDYFQKINNVNLQQQRQRYCHLCCSCCCNDAKHSTILQQPFYCTMNKNRPPSIVRLFTTQDSISTPVPTSLSQQQQQLYPKSGEEAFQQYLALKERIDKLKEENERKKSEQMYQAWKKADEMEVEKEKYNENNNSNNNNSTKKKGIAVVKTIVKQTKKDNSEYEESIERQAETMLRISAEEYKYPKALVLLANQLVLECQKKEKNLVVSSSSPSKNHDYNTRIDLLHKAMYYYKVAGEQGISEGWFNLGHILWTGIPNPTSDSTTTRTTPTPTTTTDSVHNDTEISIESEMLLNADQSNAMDAFLKACYWNDKDAMYFVGVHMLDLYDDNDDANTNTPTNNASDNDNDNDHPTIHVPTSPSTTTTNTTNTKTIQQGLEWIEKAASLNHSGALYYLAMYYLQGDTRLNIKPCTNDEYKQRLDLAAEMGNSSDAYFARGTAYIYGEYGYDINYKKAYHDFCIAAELGNSDAAISAGAMLFTGNHPGIEQNQIRAFELYQLAGELGNIEGWRNVVACYATGEGVPQSIEMAKYIAKTMLLQDLDQQS